MAILETSELHKRYRRITALKNVSLRVEKGEIYGLLGQNGAGKTTLVKILLGITRRTAGEASLMGEPAGSVRVRARIGYLPEDHQFPEYHTGYSLLDFYGRLLGVSRAVRRRRIPEMLELVGLLSRRHYKIRTYSKGMKQRVGIAQALLHEPDVFFFDEPTDGVDPVGRREIRAILQRLKERGKTIFLNSHLLSEVERICDRVGILQKGSMIREGDVPSLTRQQGVYVIGLGPDDTWPEEDVSRLGFDMRKVDGFWEVQPPSGHEIEELIDFLRSRGLRIRHLIEKRHTLEDLFIQTVDADREAT